MSDTIRTFIAISLPETIISHIRTLTDGLKSYGFNAKWMKPENIHLTLRFLGNIRQEDVEKVEGAMSEAACQFSPISLSAKGIGIFPGIRRARVIWMGLAGETHPLLELQKKLEDNLEDIGFPKEGRPFKAHLTLARIKGAADSRKLLAAMEAFGDASSDTFATDKIILYKSDLKPSGAVYTKLKLAHLVGKQNE